MMPFAALRRWRARAIMVARAPEGSAAEAAGLLRRHH
jgi:hypothetical protein